MAPRTDSREALNGKRRRAVQMRLAGESLAAIREVTGLSAPTVISAFKSFLTGGWAAVPVQTLGRRVGQGRLLSPSQEIELRTAVFQDRPGKHARPEPLWTAGAVQGLILDRWNLHLAETTVLRYLAGWGLDLTPMRRIATEGPAEAGWLATELPGCLRQARAFRSKVYWAGEVAGPGFRLLCAINLRGRPAWLSPGEPNSTARYEDFLERLVQVASGRVSVLLHGVDLARSPELQAWLRERRHILATVYCPVPLGRGPAGPAPAALPGTRRPSPPRTDIRREPTMNLTHLHRLEAEAIHIMREVAAEAEKPVMLYSIGKDSACMLRLAQKAFYPGVPPFPLLHVDTTWKFRDMYALRDEAARESGMELIVYQNPEAVDLGINPFDPGSQIHTDMWKTQGLRQALDKFGFDAAFGGARRDEEKSRAKERIFSFRSAQHRWDPKAQRPELWRLYNARKRPGESIRVFPLSNWTELDVWQYIHREAIPVVPLYFAKDRPVVERDGAWIMVDDERMRLKPGEVPVMRRIRFRTLGCYPLSGGIESAAETVPAVIREMLLARTSERQGRLIDHDQAASMEKKKQEGYF